MMLADNTYSNHGIELHYMPGISSRRTPGKMKPKLVAMAAKYRRRHPDKNLKVMFWPKAAMGS